MARIVTHQLQFSLSGVNITILSDLIESVRHDGDQHVQHSDLRKSSRQKEKCKAQSFIRVFRIVLNIKLTKSEQVLVYHHVDKVVIVVICNQIKVWIDEVVQHLDWKTKH